MAVLRAEMERKKGDLGRKGAEDASNSELDLSYDQKIKEHRSYLPLCFLGKGDKR